MITFDTFVLFSIQSAAINRLAAAHRGAFRALQVIIHQLSDLSYNKVPPHYKELGQLIRQLSLCSAKVEVDQGSAVPEIALDILQKLEVRSNRQVFFNVYFVQFFKSISELFVQISTVSSETFTP